MTHRLASGGWLDLGPRLVGIACILGLVACGHKESETALVARSYAAAVHSGDTAQVMQWLDSATVARIEAAAQRATDQIGGRRPITAPEMLQITGFDPLFVIDRVVEVSNDGERTQLEVVGTSGQVEHLFLVNEPQGWRVSLRVPEALASP